MAKKPKRKLTADEKGARARRKVQFTSIFLNGRQKKVRRRHCIEGQTAHDFISSNADPMWLHQNEMWELIADSVPDEACLASPDDELLWA